MMMNANNGLVATNYRGRHLWNVLHNARTGFLTRCERYAAVTIPKVHLPDHTDQNSDSIKYDWSSFGAQCVNHLTNRLIMGLFQPNFPFFRLDLSKEAKAMALAAVSSQSPDEGERMILQVMNQGEQAALRVFDRKALRPLLYEVLRALVVVGNVAMDYRFDTPQVRHLRQYVVRRSMNGRLIKILFYDELLYDELEDDAKSAIQKVSPDSKVTMIQEFIRTGNTWKLTQYINDQELPADRFSHEWEDDEFPIKILCWDRAHGADYGTGLVEDYSADFGNLSVLTESEVKLAIQLSDYRWLAHPTGMGDVNDFKNTRTGDVVPGGPNDLSMVVSSQRGQTLEAVANSAALVIQRLGRAFLMGSAVTRNAERVTAEEIRMTAQELETSFGGVYSRLAVDLQMPLVYWLMKEVDLDISGTAIEPTIVTGMDALGRSAEASQLMWFMQDLAGIGALGPLAMRLKVGQVAAVLAAARGLDPDRFLLTDEQFAQAQQQQMAQQQELMATEALTQEGAKAINNQG